METEIKYIEYNSEPIKVRMDGETDIANVVERLTNYFGNIVVRRLNSLSNHINGDQEANKVETLINDILAQIPDENELWDHLWLKGGIHNSPVIEPHDYVQFEFDFFLEDDRHPNNRPHLADFS